MSVNAHRYQGQLTPIVYLFAHKEIVYISSGVRYQQCL